MIDAARWRGRRTLVTGHTGFKGSWLCAWLLRLGATVCGLALPPDTKPSLYEELHLEREIDGAIVDVRDRSGVAAVLERARPEIVLHLAAQPLVRASAADPEPTYATNVLGLVHLLDAVRALDEPPAFLCVTSDKVYAASAGDRAFVESDPLGGDDPYSASKACAELVVASYDATFGARERLRLCTARAGNVIGGGDWARDRLVPDVVRAIGRGEAPLLRNPNATRPWQHVLDALAGYLALAHALDREPARARGAWNFGPAEPEMPTVAQVAERVSARLGGERWRGDRVASDGLERAALRIDSSKARAALGWRSRLSIDDAIAWTAEWYGRFASGEPASRLVDEQIAAYEALGA